jgi:DNA (cytosine-5)-methyltransferase 1
MRPRTLADCIGNISPTASHQTEHYFPDMPRPTRSRWDTPLTHTILAGGGSYDVHPDGLRRFTVRELACIQTFPETHDFVGSDVEKKKTNWQCSATFVRSTDLAEGPPISPDGG